MDRSSPEKIVWCYREWQPAYETLQDQVKYIRDIPEEDKKLEGDFSTRLLLIFDDMMDGKAIESIVDLFTHKAHHRNTSVIYITQNVFDRAAQHRTISLNAHYMAFFKKPQRQISNHSLESPVKYAPFNACLRRCNLHSEFNFTDFRQIEVKK